MVLLQTEPQLENYASVDNMKQYTSTVDEYRPTMFDKTLI